MKLIRAATTPARPEQIPSSMPAHFAVCEWHSTPSPRLSMQDFQHCHLSKVASGYDDDDDDDDDDSMVMDVQYNSPNDS